MKKYLLAFFSGALMVSGSAIADSLSFSKQTVNTDKPGGTVPAAMMHMTNGQKHLTKVQLPTNVAVKNIRQGQLVYLPTHRASYKVISVTGKSDGTKVVNIVRVGKASVKPIPTKQQGY